nr:u0002h [Mycobacterium tuberculosis]
MPANAFVADYLPGEAAAARSAVVVCNGGSLTTQQALVAGVPVIGVAGNLDQHLNMEAVERAGAGVLLRTERLKSQRVAGAVMQVISRSEYPTSRRATRRCLRTRPRWIPAACGECSAPHAGEPAPDMVGQLVTST